MGKINFNLLRNWISRCNFCSFLVAFVLGGLIFHFFLPEDFFEKKQDEIKEVRQSGYNFINPLLECEVNDEKALKKYIPFENRIKNRIQEEVAEENENVRLSVYFRNLNNGPWFGINESESFSPASLLKVPLMIAYLKLSENDRELFSKKIQYSEPGLATISQVIHPKEKLEAGKSYSVEDLIYRMIAYSDNEAMNLLAKDISRNDLNKIYSDLGVSVPNAMNPNDFMTVKDYASFFRILYNAAYLDKKTSEKALEILSKTEYDNGLIAGVGEGVVVAHKFGEREFQEGDGIKRQLHDCGIVYYNKYPYLLCIMTRGNDFKKLSGIIAQTSKIVFDEIKSDFP